MITDKYIHVHIPRTGGSTLRGISQELTNRGKLKIIDGTAHRTLEQMHWVRGDLPAIAFVRNPFDWYVSQYHRRCDAEGFKGSFEQYFDKYVVKGGKTLTCWWFYFTGNDVQYIGRFENYTEDILRIVTGLVPQTNREELLTIMDRLGKVRQSWTRKPYEEYYNERLRDAVYAFDSWYFRCFDYHFRR